MPCCEDIMFRFHVTLIVKIYLAFKHIGIWFVANPRNMKLGCKLNALLFFD